MFQFLKKLLGFENETPAWLEKGAVVIDVRTPGEFKRGHVDGSLNVSLDKIPHSIAKLKKLNKPIIFCCASGNRSGQATGIAKENGIDCYNGGSWTSVRSAVNAFQKA